MTPSATNKSSIAAAIAQVSKALDPVQKESAKGLRHTFLGADRIVEAIRDPLSEAGLAIVPVEMELLGSADYQTRGGTTMHSVRIKAYYEIRHAVSGESMTCAALGEAADSGDKCIAKAITMSWKSLVRIVFSISGQDDPDYKQHERTGVARKVSSAPAPISQPVARNSAGNGEAEIKLSALKTLIGQLGDSEGCVKAICQQRNVSSLDELSVDAIEELIPKIDVYVIGERIESNPEEAAKN